MRTQINTFPMFNSNMVINNELTIQEDDCSTKSIAEEDVVSNNRSDTGSNNETNNINHAKVSNSGNSDVDINIHIDLSALAFAMLYLLFAAKQLSSEELELALRRLEAFKAK